MTPSLPLHPNLDHLKKQAKAFLSQLKNGSPVALQRIKKQHPKCQKLLIAELKEKAFSLADVQLVIAREYGFPSWPKMKAHIEVSALNISGLVNELINSALAGNLKHVHEIVKSNSDLAAKDFYVALVLGNDKGVRKMLTEAPSLVSKKGGPKNWEAILYACYSRLLGLEKDKGRSFVEIVKMLLDKGADPNSYFLHGVKPFEDTKETALYGAGGLNNSVAVAALLLEAGAKASDGESLYHSAEHGDNEMLKLLFKYKANPDEKNAFKRKLDFEDLEGAKLFLDNRANPNLPSVTLEGVAFRAGDTPFHHAIRRGRSAKMLKLIFENGGDPNAKNVAGQSVYALAARYGRKDVIKIFKTKAKADALSSLDEFIGACFAEDENTAKKILLKNPNLKKQITEADSALLTDAAKLGKAKTLKLLLDASFDIRALGESKETAAHQAAWFGHADCMEVILKYRPDLEDVRNIYEGPVMGWALHAVRFGRNPKGDYPNTVKMLLKAGAKLEGRSLENLPEDVMAVLRTSITRGKSRC